MKTKPETADAKKEFTVVMFKTCQSFATNDEEALFVAFVAVDLALTAALMICNNDIPAARDTVVSALNRHLKLKQRKQKQP